MLPPAIASSGGVEGPPPVLELHAAPESPPVQWETVELNEEESFEPVKFVRSHKTEAEMDMTPMVDVVFLLLIFFMITAAFGMQKSIEVPDPESDQSSQQAKIPEEREKTEEDIVVNISREDRVYVEGEEATTPQELYAKLREHQYQDSKRQVRHLLVVAESEATHETVVRVLDAAAGVGMSSVRLKTE